MHTLLQASPLGNSLSIHLKFMLFADIASKHCRYLQVNNFSVSENHWALKIIKNSLFKIKVR